MFKRRSQRFVLNLAGITGIALAGVVLITPREAKAVNPVAKPNYALTINDAIIDFGRNEDRVTIKCNLIGVDKLNAIPADFTIKVTIVDNRVAVGTGEHIAPPSPATVVR